MALQLDLFAEKEKTIDPPPKSQGSRTGLEMLLCSQKALAQVLGVTPARVNQLIAENIVVRDEYDKQGQVYLVDSLRNYYLSKNASGGSVDFWKEKGLHEKAKRETAELKLSQLRGETYEAETIEAALTEVMVQLKTQLLGLPSKLSAILEGKSRSDIFQILTTEIEERLDECSGLDR